MILTKAAKQRPGACDALRCVWASTFKQAKEYLKATDSYARGREDGSGNPTSDR